MSGRELQICKIFHFSQNTNFVFSNCRQKDSFSQIQKSFQDFIPRSAPCKHLENENVSSILRKFWGENLENKSISLPCRNLENKSVTMYLEKILETKLRKKSVSLPCKNLERKSSSPTLKKFSWKKCFSSLVKNFNRTYCSPYLVKQIWNNRSFCKRLQQTRIQKKGQKGWKWKKFHVFTKFWPPKLIFLLPGPDAKILKMTIF